MPRKTGISIRSYAEATLSATRSQQQPSDSAEKMQIEESERATLCTTLNTRPVSTKRKYEGYQSELGDWCNEHHFCDGGTVTKGKLHLFLTERVVTSPKRKNARLLEDRLSVDMSMRSSICIISKSHYESTPMIILSPPKPQAQATATTSQNYQDRGVGSLLDGYHSEAQFRQICGAFFDLNDISGRAELLVSHYGLLRGENIRDLGLADMFSQELDREEYQTCTALHGKTNTFGKLQHVGFIRNKDVHLCPVGAVAFHLFELFHVDSEPFPSFQLSKDWYDIKFFVVVIAQKLYHMKPTKKLRKGFQPS
ncbi:LOW QUALITY PROTEIN: hypothetical protein PHMEG_00017445 [Phytophthora megakarya]|uniref:Ndc10 domain-containing protein n=1 Tax=Phytophthora megakarya TaxID=4795 RepID=A0A225VWH1_9STRA|nr:LOW QUALITY PROTEIN: hypothetical protein PHMEG_00017445 [Phytophthora megakarya]